MNFVWLIVLVGMLSACSASSRADNDTNSRTGAFNSADSNSAMNNDISNTDSTENQIGKNDDDETSEDSKGELEKYRIVPDEFKAVDFKNFYYPTESVKGGIKLKNGKFEKDDLKNCDNHFGGLGDVLYFDLTGKSTKQAFVIVNDVSCGCGSCDGGSSLIYVFDAVKTKPKLLWRLPTGSRAYGDALASIKIGDKQIVVETHGKCSKEEAQADANCWSKFSAKNIERETYAFNGKTFVKKSGEKIITPSKNIMNSPFDIEILF